MSLPNLITLARLLAVPVIVYMILVAEIGSAFWLFVAAGVSDALDGFLARVMKAKTRLGSFLDPLADKTLLVSVYLALGGAGLLPLWLVILVVSRDLMIVGGVLLMFALQETLAMQPIWISKLNTFVQLALAAMVLAVSGAGVPDALLFGWPITRILIWSVAATTILSGAAYLLRNARLFRGIGGA